MRKKEGTNGQKKKTGNTYLEKNQFSIAFFIDSKDLL